jgi:predicted O-linked N-acetylglucosamine transferase (SPINDLY family)
MWEKKKELTARIDETAEPLPQIEIEQLAREALAYYRAGRLAEAEDFSRRVLENCPLHATSLHILGVAACKTGKLEEGVAWFRRVLAAKPTDVRAYINLGNALNELGVLAEAISCYERALGLDLNSVEACNGLATALRKQGQIAEAVNLYRRAIRLRADYAEAYNGLGNAFVDDGKLEDAVIAYRQAISIKHDYSDAEGNLGIALRKLGKIEDAVSSYRRTLRLKPDHVGALSGLIREKRRLCDWSDHVSDDRKLKALANSPTAPPIDPYNFLTAGLTAEEQMQCARKWASNINLSTDAIIHHGDLSSVAKRKIRIGYLSSDFREHPIGHVTCELFERHDRSCFEVIAYSNGPDDGSGIRKRLIASFDRFIDIRRLSDSEAARQICDDGIDILVDLNGYSEGSRIRMLAHRPAPIQVHYLGFPATLGTTFIDYIIVDPFVAPMDQQRFFAEKLVHLPNCFFVNDGTRGIATPKPSRAECGLPAHGFVFCSFNNFYKLTPDMFDIWMRCLREIPGSVLWLRQGPPTLVSNLCREAESRKVHANRLVFAPRLPEMTNHLARQQQADLFLDTLPYNAHTTASDALWAGLPVLTCAGNTLSGRVAGSMLKAIGLPELVTTSREEYAEHALRLAREPVLLSRLRESLARNRNRTALFDTKRFTRHLEAAYEQMVRYRVTGSKPTAFSVRDQNL